MKPGQKAMIFWMMFVILSVFSDTSAAGEATPPTLGTINIFTVLTDTHGGASVDLSASTGAQYEVSILIPETFPPRALPDYTFSFRILLSGREVIIPKTQASPVYAYYTVLMPDARVVRRNGYFIDRSIDEPHTMTIFIPFPLEDLSALYKAGVGVIIVKASGRYSREGRTEKIESEHPILVAKILEEVKRRGSRRIPQKEKNL